jgi:biopolymer transport protein ExbB/TolQ
LITTQTGLMIAIPGYIFISLVIRARNNYMAFVAELETVVVQRIHKLEDAQ